MKLKNKILAIFALILSLGVVSCASTADTPVNEHVDYVNGDTVRLSLEYKGHSFLKDGVGQVSLKTAIDGDTAHFNDENGELIKCRFYGIDTPESTGKIQPYGKAASNFTKEKLENADENGTIVISVPSTEYTLPSHDSTGSRYLALIWINETVKNCDKSELVLLNLMLVQEGYSEVKNANEMPSFEDTFRAAWTQAQNEKLNLFSGEDDPLFNYGDYEDTSLLDMKIEVENQIAAAEKGESYTNKYDGANVRVVGTVAGFANHILYLQNFYSKENGARVDEGEYAGICIYTGMSSIPSKYTKINTYIQVCGVASDSENFGFQISGASFPSFSASENDAKVLISPDDNTDEFKLYEFNKSLDEINISNLDALYSNVNIEEKVVITGGYESDSKVALYFEDENGKDFGLTIYMTFIYKPDETNPSLQWTNVEDFVGKTFTLSGILAPRKLSSGKYTVQILPRSSADFVLVT